VTAPALVLACASAVVAVVCWRRTLDLADRLRAAEADARWHSEHVATVRASAVRLLGERDEQIARLEATRCAFCATAAKRTARA
jgi:hypothetical protein